MFFIFIMSVLYLAAIVLMNYEPRDGDIF